MSLVTPVAAYTCADRFNKVVRTLSAVAGEVAAGPDSSRCCSWRQALPWLGRAVYALPVNDRPFTWPGRYRAAVSFTFDDARLSQVDHGLPVFEEHNFRSTFYVSLDRVAQRPEQWRAAAAWGHEIGNHSMRHPCTANYEFSRRKGACTEDYTAVDIAADLREADAAIERHFGERPRTFAYPCGETHVGRGREAVSYVPVVAERYLAGRGYHHEHPNDPRYCDLAHLLSYRLDMQPWEQHTVVMEGARESGEWVIFSGHETGGPEDDFLNITISDLKRVLLYLDGRRDSLWVAPVCEVATWIVQQRHERRCPE